MKTLAIYCTVEKEKGGTSFRASHEGHLDKETVYFLISYLVRHLKSRTSDRLFDSLKELF